MADKETQKYLDEYKKKVAAEKAKDPKAFAKKVLDSLNEKKIRNQKNFFRSDSAYAGSCGYNCSCRLIVELIY